MDREALVRPKWRVLCGDARELDLPDESVHCILLSPPYLGLRKYIDDPLEIGREPTLDEWLQNLVECAREWKRILRPKGTLWINVGDSYASSPRGNRSGDVSTSTLTNPHRQDGIDRDALDKVHASGLKQKDLIGLPHTLAFALRDDGWWLRSAICWIKGVDWLSGERQAQEDVRDTLRRVREEAEGSLFGLSKGLDRALKRTEKAVDRLVMSGSVMPESVTDRPTSAYEMLFMFSKSKRYFFDQEAIRCPAFTESRRTFRGSGAYTHYQNFDNSCSMPVITEHGISQKSPDRNPRNVWRIGTQAQGSFILSDGTECAHFASFPVALAERVIKCATSEYGCCASCGAAFVRVTERGRFIQTGGSQNTTKIKDVDDRGAAFARTNMLPGRFEHTTIAWHPTCTHRFFRLRDDLSNEERAYVLRELDRRGIRTNGLVQ